MIKSLEQRKLERQAYNNERQKRWEEAYNKYIENIEHYLNELTSKNESALYFYVSRTFDFDERNLAESIRKSYIEKGFIVDLRDSTPSKPDSYQLLISGW